MDADELRGALDYCPEMGGIPELAEGLHRKFARVE